MRLSKRSVFIVCIILTGIFSCDKSRKYHLNKKQAKTQSFEAKPAIKITQENLKNKEYKMKEYKEQLDENTEKQNEDNKTKRSSKKRNVKPINFY